MSKRKCRICEKYKEEIVDNFYQRKDNGKFRSECIDCTLEYKKKWHLENYPKNIERNREISRMKGKKRRERVGDLIREEKNKKCKDCGIKYPYYVMDFDHRLAQDKTFNVSQWSKTSKKDKEILEEIAKCDVVCSNCHRERTHKRREINNEVLFS